VHIGITALWVLPVIAAGPLTRIAFAIGSASLHLAVSQAFYYEWVWQRPGIDGGPLGFLTWSLPLLAGSLAYDVVLGRKSIRAGLDLLVGGSALMVLGYLLACASLWTQSDGSTALGDGSWFVEPPFVPPSTPITLWTMSQRAGSVSYQVFGAGFSLALFALFVWACDSAKVRSRIFAVLGGNALAAYIIHLLVAPLLKPFAPADSPLWYVTAAFGLYLAICYLFLRHLEKHQLYLRL
jgi:hypothetical protein